MMTGEWEAGLERVRRGEARRDEFMNAMADYEDQSDYCSAFMKFNSTMIMSPPCKGNYAYSTVRHPNTFIYP